MYTMYRFFAQITPITDVNYACTIVYPIYKCKYQEAQNIENHLINKRKPKIAPMHANVTNSPFVNLCHHDLQFLAVSNCSMTCSDASTTVDATLLHVFSSVMVSDVAWATTPDICSILISVVSPSWFIDVMTLVMSRSILPDRSLLHDLTIVSWAISILDVKAWLSWLAFFVLLHDVRPIARSNIGIGSLFCFIVVVRLIWVRLSERREEAVWVVIPQGLQAMGVDRYYERDIPT